VNGHLSDRELRAFVRHDIEAGRAIAVDDHLAVCADCRRRASTVGDAEARLGDLSVQVQSDPHFSEEDLQRYISRDLSVADRSRLDQHLGVCRTCAKEVEDLRRWAATRPRTWSPWYFAAAAAIVVIALVPFALSPGSPTEPPRVQESLAGLDLLPADAAARVKAALSAGVVTLPAALTELTNRTETLMGKPAGASFQPVSPVATVVVSDRPVFRWSALPDAEGYSVSLFDVDLRQVARSDNQADTSWTPPQPLPRDRVYVWQVTARRGSESIVAPAPPSPLARFRVMDESASTMLEGVSGNQPRSHLLLGILYAQAGARDEAEAHLQEVPTTDPYVEVARRTLEQLGNANR
jgi:anti-sigma factor RsiW